MKLLVLFAALATTASATAYARDVNLPSRVSRVCVGKTQNILQNRVQVKRWFVNGRTSNLSTFYYPGRFASLKLDVDEANVVVSCKKPGRENFQFQFRLNYADPNTYRVMVRLDCVPCAKAGAKEARKKIAAARQLVRVERPDPRRNQMAMKQLQLAHAELSSLLESEDLSPRSRAELRKLMGYFGQLMQLVREGAGSSGQAQEIFQILERGLAQL